MQLLLLIQKPLGRGDWLRREYYGLRQMIRQIVKKNIRSFFEEGRDTDVLSGLSDVLNERPPVWRQQWLTMVAAVSAWRTKRGKVALELISQLDQRPLPLMILAWLPIAWTNQITAEPLVADALARLSDPSPIVQLIASSWLLSSVHRNIASEKIKELITSDRTEVAQLASALLWRVATPEQVKKSAEDWRDEIDRMPLMLQGGPLVLLKSKLRSSGRRRLSIFNGQLMSRHS